MPPPFVPVKKPEGQAELSQRGLRSIQRHRTALLRVDGRRSIVHVQTLARQAGVPQSCVDELLHLRLIVVSQPTVALPRAAAVSAAPPLEIDVILDDSTPIPSVLEAPDDSELPASRALQPESLFTDSKPAEFSAADATISELATTRTNDACDQARDLLLRAVRAEAPMNGSLTLLGLRRARTLADLEALLDEVAARISKPQRLLAAGQTLRRVRQLLDGRRDSPLSTF